MDNLEKLIKEAKPNKYSNKKKNQILEDLITSEGTILPWVKAMEELAELINVTCENLCGKVDRLHTAEEIIDVRLFLKTIQNSAGIKDNNLKKPHKHKKITKKHVIKALSALSKAQQEISKCIRVNKMNKSTALTIINEVNQAIYIIESVYKIKKKALGRIDSLKYTRCKKVSQEKNTERLEWLSV